MDKKSFSVIIIILVVTFTVISFVKFYRPQSKAEVNFSEFPLSLNGWVGSKENVQQYVLDLLNPQDVFSATYVNDQGIEIHLFFDFFSSDQGFGGPHSPRNCLPGSGWIIQENRKHIISLSQKEITGHRLKLRYENRYHIMDFWYVTHHGETGNDYLFKIYEIISSLTFQPKDIAFIRFITEDRPENEIALKEFQVLFTEEIYKQLPFNKIL